MIKLVNMRGRTLFALVLCALLARDVYIDFHNAHNTKATGIAKKASGGVIK